MFKRFRKALAVTAASLAIAAVPLAVAVPATVSAQASGDKADIGYNLRCGSNLDTKGTTCEVTDGGQKVNDIISDIVNIFSVIVGIVSVVMIIYGGFRYVTSGGDSGNVSNAKSTIIYAIIGLVIVALAQFIVQFVLEKVTQI